MATTSTPHVVRVQDADGEGTCSSCGREGLRWVVTLSDDSTVGSECAKKALGWTVQPARYRWTCGAVPVAPYTERDVTWVLWEKLGGTLSSRNGHLMAIGGQRAEWLARGWIQS